MAKQVTITFKLAEEERLALRLVLLRERSTIQAFLGACVRAKIGDSPQDTATQSAGKLHTHKGP